MLKKLLAHNELFFNYYKPRFIWYFNNFCMESFRKKHNVFGGSKKFSLGVPTSPSKISSILE